MCVILFLRYVGITILSNLTLMLIGHNFRKYKLLKTKYIHLPVDRVFQVGSICGKESTCQCRRWKRHEFDPWVGKMPWNRKEQPTPVFLPGKFHRERSLTGYSPWNHKELVRAEVRCTHTCW